MKKKLPRFNRCYYQGCLERITAPAEGQINNTAARETCDLHKRTDQSWLWLARLIVRTRSLICNRGGAALKRPAWFAIGPLALWATLNLAMLLLPIALHPHPIALAALNVQAAAGDTGIDGDAKEPPAGLGQHYLYPPPSGPRYGSGVGAEFGGYIAGLRRSGFDLVLVIDSTGAMRPIVGDLAGQMQQLVRAVHRLVPATRIGIVEFGDYSESIHTQPLTTSADRLQDFLVKTKVNGVGGEKNTQGAISTAVNTMSYKAGAKRVIVLMGDSLPSKAKSAQIMGSIRKFRRENGTLSTISLAQEQHERLGRGVRQGDGKQPPINSSLLELSRKTQAAYAAFARAGGGSMSLLHPNSPVGQLVLILAFGERWEQQVSPFGRQIGPGPSPPSN